MLKQQNRSDKLSVLETQAEKNQIVAVRLSVRLSKIYVW